VAIAKCQRQPPQLATTGHSATRSGGTNGNTSHHRSRHRGHSSDYRAPSSLAEGSNRRTNPRSIAIRNKEEENIEGVAMTNYRDALFSVHGNEGRLAIYLEERDAVLDLVEETGREVHADYIADLAVYGKIENLKSSEGFDRYTKHREKLDPTVLLIASMDIDEALNLAEQILLTVRAMKAPTTPRLELVK